MKKQVSLSFMMMGILFNVCLLLSNILATKIITIGVFSPTAGLLIFPVSYIINDCIAEVWGFKKARFIIWTGFAMNFLAVFFYQLSIIIPEAPFWDGQAAYAQILGQTPRVAVASLSAFLIGSFLNAYVMSRMKVLSGGKRFGLRAIVSTIIGESADSMVFFTVALAGIIPTQHLLVMIVSQTVMKSVYEVLVLPLTTRVVKYIKQTENTDVYDTEVSYNVLKVGDV